MFGVERAMRAPRRLTAMAGPDICIGAHVVRAEPPDMLIVHFVGDVSGEEMRRIIAEQRRFEAGKDYVLLISEVSRAGTITSEAREAVPVGTKGSNARAMAIVGASFHVRVIATLLATAAMVLNKFEGRATRFFKTEEQAREWLAEVRASIRETKA